MTRRFLIIWTNPLFRESIRLVLNHPETQCAGTSPDYAGVRDLALELQPDTVIVEEIEGAIPATVLGLLEEDALNLRVIGVNLADNTMNIFHREQQIVADIDDLIRLVLQ